MAIASDLNALSQSMFAPPPRSRGGANAKSDTGFAALLDTPAKPDRSAAARADEPEAPQGPAALAPAREPDNSQDARDTGRQDGGDGTARTTDSKSQTAEAGNGGEADAAEPAPAIEVGAEAAILPSIDLDAATLEQLASAVAAAVPPVVEIAADAAAPGAAVAIATTIEAVSDSAEAGEGTTGADPAGKETSGTTAAEAETETAAPKTPAPLLAEAPADPTEAVTDRATIADLPEAPPAQKPATPDLPKPDPATEIGAKPGNGAGAGTETTAAATTTGQQGESGEGASDEKSQPTRHADATAGKETAARGGEAASETSAKPLPPAEPLGSAPQVTGHAQAAGVGQTNATQTATAPQSAANGIPPSASPVPVEGLAVEIAARAQQGRNRFEIRLDPPELGRIDVRLDIDTDGKVSSRLVVERAETLEMLRRDASQLERALQQAGLKTGDNGLQFQLQDQQFAGQNDDGSPRDAETLLVTELDPVGSDTITGYGRLFGQGRGLDIRV